jgi:hypothetical protein
MHNLLLICLIQSSIFSVLTAGLQQAETTSTPPPLAILSPLPGQALQGIVPIQVSLNGREFQSLELSFAYQDDPTDTWFLIYETHDPTVQGELTQWDTTTLTDGEYTLRLTLLLQDGSQIREEVPNLRLRNYTAVETNTPVPTFTQAPGDTPIPTTTLIPTITPIPATSTALPPNSAQITRQDIAFSLGKGALGALVALAFLGLYTIIRNAIRR